MTYDVSIQKNSSENLNDYRNLMKLKITALVRGDTPVSEESMRHRIGIRSLKDLSEFFLALEEMVHDHEIEMRGEYIFGNRYGQIAKNYTGVGE
jgi:hypothetical protein